jgi:hypothetical protein
MDGRFLFDEILFQMKLVSHKRFLLKHTTKCWFQVELDEILGGGVKWSQLEPNVITFRVIISLM